MLSIEEIMGMIATEIAENMYNLDFKKYEKSSEKLPIINYNLRLIRYPDGRMEWEE